MAFKPVVIIQHARHEHPAALRRALETQGIPTLWIHPYRGDEYPSVDEISGVLSLGGPMSSNDEALHPWIPKELKLLQSCLARKLPILGVCLGGQLLARSLGHQVTSNPVAEVGWFPLTLTDAGLKDPIFGTHLHPTVYHFHFETFELPRSAERLAASEACANQAYRIEENAYGLQFHPEADHQLLGEWLSLEGFEDEIRQVQLLHGEKWVQDAKTQVELAHRVELESISLVTAFSTIFRKKPYKTIDSSLRTQVELWELLKVPVQAAFRSGSGGTTTVRGVIERTFTLGEAEFVVLRGEDWLVWPLALADLKLITPVSK
jgi:GMP synthase (glutamine-hydrolysing)